MRVSGSGAGSMRLQLLLSLAALWLSDANEPGTAMTTRDINQQTRESISDYTVKGHDLSTPGSHLSTQDFNQQTEENISNLTSVVYSKSIDGFSSAPVEENVILYNPANIALLCNLTRASTDSATVEVTWKKDNERVESSNVTINETKNVWSTQYTLKIRDRNQMGNYTCVFKSDQEVNATFHLQVPQIEGKEHHVVSYVGDTVVLVCKSLKYIPINWIWYMSNGSDQVAINDSLMPDKYIVDEKYANITKLKILKISEKDDRSYWCQAVFKLGESKGKVSLKVLTYMTPLKPFLAIAAEVIILVAIIFLYEIYSKKKQMHAEDEKEFEQIEQLKSEDSNGVENSTTRHRKV
uniref:Embigin n=1 Tax=Chrysemys picta bellii TaxID=8478 RepID=A0A8C3FMS8_CHRPI|nr:embigin [Chrysemys picta bellii]